MDFLPMMKIMDCFEDVDLDADQIDETYQSFRKK